MKIYFIRRTKSEIKISSKSIQVDTYSSSPEKSLKLTHWPSRYKKGIQLIHIRKQSEKCRKSTPIRLSYNKTPVTNLQKLPQISLNLKNKLNNRKLPDSDCFQVKKLRIKSAAPQIQLNLSGKALNLIEFHNEKINLIQSKPNLVEIPRLKFDSRF
jgi:hypothetical protein